MKRSGNSTKVAPSPAAEGVGAANPTTGQSTPNSGRSPVVRVSITDTGRGISAADLERVFDFGARRLEDTEYADSDNVPVPSSCGFGLSICNQLVSQMGGAIWAESSLGRGSTFTFTLPAATGAEAISMYD